MMGWFFGSWVRKALYLKTRDELENTRTQKAQVQSAFQNAERELTAMEKSRDWYKAEWEKLKVDQRDKDALCAEKNDLLQQVQNLEADVERLNEKVEATNKANATERQKLIAERDAISNEKDALHRDASKRYDEIKARNKEVMEDADALKDDLVQAEFDRDKFKDERDNFKEVIAEKDSEIEELADQHARAERALEDRKAVDAKRPVIEVEVYESTQGPKRSPCMRFVARHDGDVVAVSPPQGTRDKTHARERTALLSAARWVIVTEKGKA